MGLGLAYAGTQKAEVQVSMQCLCHSIVTSSQLLVSILCELRCWLRQWVQVHGRNHPMWIWFVISHALTSLHVHCCQSACCDAMVSSAQSVFAQYIRCLDSAAIMAGQAEWLKLNPL